MKRANIDADVLCYALGSLHDDHPFLKDEEGKPLSKPASVEIVEARIMESIEGITEAAGCDVYTCYLSGKTNYRTAIAVTFPYKGNRKNKDKPYHFQTVYDYIKALPDTVVIEGREADDGLADAQTADTVLCSIDKDLLMVEGSHYNWKHDEDGVITVTDAEGFKWFCKQLLTGDWSTDSILGCAKLVDKVYGPKAQKAGQQYTQRQGIGPKQADDLLLSATTKAQQLSVVATQYRAMFGDEWNTKLDEMGILLWMGGSQDNLWSYNKAIKEVTK